MKKSDIHDLMLGAVVVVLGYALYQHFKTAPSSQPYTPYGKTPMGVNVGETVGGANSDGSASPFTSLRDLLTGTVHDIGGFNGRNYLAEIEGGSFY